MSESGETERFKHPETLRETVRVLIQGGMKTKLVAEQCGVNHNTLRTWIGRYRWNEQVAEAKAITERVNGRTAVSAIAIAPNRPASKLREELTAEVSHALALIREKRPKTVQELRNTREREGLASVLARLADSAEKIEDWAGQKKGGILVIGEVPGPPEVLKRAQASVPNTATDCSPKVNQDVPRPQSAEVIADCAKETEVPAMRQTIGPGA
jgi:hypothetical protein